MVFAAASRRLIPVFAALVVPAGVAAAPITRSAPAEVGVLSPLSVIKRADLDFGTFVVTGAGTAVIDPVSGTLTTTGAVTKAGIAAHPARFTSTGSKNSIVHIRLPQNPITVTRIGGTETMTVSTWTLDGALNRRIPLNTTFDFAVGATLNVAANQAEGSYAGTFTITVQYP
jgi:hypothetical protein